MARFEISGFDEMELMLSTLEANIIPIGKKAVEEAINIVADQMRSNIENLPEDSFRKLAPGEEFKGVPAQQKKDLLDSMGVTHVDISNSGYINAKVGFDGYGSYMTKKYPQGLPNQLLARVIESGSSVRRKTPFIRTTIKKTEQAVVDKIQEVITSEIEKL